MGYSTEFKGELKFTKEATAKQLAKLNSMFGEDCRDHPEWNAKGLYYVDLVLCDDFSGIMWSGAQKTYSLEKVVNVVLTEMRKEWPDFGLTGMLAAQGEDIEDRWMLIINDDGLAEKRPIALTGKIIKCPHCCGKIEIENETHRP